MPPPQACRDCIHLEVEDWRPRAGYGPLQIGHCRQRHYDRGSPNPTWYSMGQIRRNAEPTRSIAASCPDFKRRVLDAQTATSN